VNGQGKKELQQREEQEEVMAREKERNNFGRGEKESAPLDALYKRRERASTPWKERGKFDRRERENFNRGERERE
jgi:hypothetical protein